MIWFYCPDIRGEFAHFDENEAHHCVQVLRHRLGDIVHWIDGRGNLYEGCISDTGKKVCVAKITNTITNYGQRSYSVTLAVAPPKNTDRVAWLTEKCTEIGLDTLAPVWCSRSERTHLRADRLQGIAVSATKQSKQATVPKVCEPKAFAQWLNETQKLPAETQKFIAWCSDEPVPHLADLYTRGSDVVMLIGPEGDFTPAEVLAAQAVGFRAISLGDTRLRTETAAFTAVQTVAFVNRC